ncbi:hypothetical protein FQN54_003666 [Arachnomyces sp. PD_36]|nr:hypothetical protein FQN54_003666 [Arachnomyces sp. PD_36]
MERGSSYTSHDNTSGERGEQESVDLGNRPLDDLAQDNEAEQEGGTANNKSDDGAGQHNDGQGAEKPPWSELKTKAGKERKRLPLACIACRRKKIRCSGEKPACKHCFRSRVPCVYKVTTRKAAPRTDYMAMLDKRLKRMEERVIKIIPKEEERDMALIGRATVKPSAAASGARTAANTKPAHKRKRSADDAFSSEYNEWAHPENRRTSFHDIVPFSKHRRAGGENRLLVEGAEFLPPMEIQEHLSEVFFDCVYGQSYLLLHKPSFMRRLSAGTVPPVLILAVCAVSARFSTHPSVNSEPAFLRGEDWANPAADIALSRHDEPNITILTVLLLLGLHEFGTCHGGRSWSFGGQALRMAYALQLHRELDRDPLGQNNGKVSELSFTDREIRRRTMWACVLMDRFNSSGSERPPIGNEKFLHIQLPIKETHFQMEIPGPTEDLDGSVPNPVPQGLGQLSNPKENMGPSAYIIRAIILWGRIVDYLNLGGKKNDPLPLWSPRSGYAQLKKQLDDFAASLPSSLVFTIENLQNHAAEKVANQFLLLHIVAHQNTLFLNRFAIPLSPGGRPPKDMPRPFLSEAGRAAVEAANNISMLIEHASGYLLTVPFAGYCAYASCTVHIWGIFSKNAHLEATSKANLRHTYKYLNKMKRYWGMFHYMVESAKDRYRQFADAALRGPTAEQNGKDSPMFQYGDWFDKYPHGVSKTHWEDPEPDPKKETGGDAVMSQQPDLQSVEEFFASLSPPPPRKQTKLQKPPAQRLGSPTNNHNMGPSPALPQQQQQLVDIPIQLQNTQPPIIGDTTNPSQPFPNNNQPPNPNIYPQRINQQTFHQPPFDFPLNSDQLPQLDRQLVFGAYAGDETTAANATASFSSLPPNGTGLGTIPPDPVYWPDHLNMGGAGGAGEAFQQPSAWFLPFNLDPMGTGLDGFNAPPEMSAANNGGAGNPMVGSVVDNGVAGGGGGNAFDDGMVADRFNELGGMPLGGGGQMHPQHR